MKKRKHKYCPKCGKATDINDDYCTRCGYSFRGKQHKKIGLKKILLGALVVLAIWIVLRIVLKKPVVPDWLNILIKNLKSTNSSK